ncbi:MAG: lysostaphin resistance A-like protein [Polyangiaceae bacterium]
MAIGSTMVSGSGEHTLGAQAERLGAHGESRRGAEAGRSLTLVAAVYGGVAAAATGIAMSLGRNPLRCDGWIGKGGPSSWLMSLGLGVLAGAATLAATRIMLRRWNWMQELLIALRPSVHRAGSGSLLAVALASATGEELLFRGLLVPMIGVLASSVAFGGLHQIRGPASWAWMAWATLTGLLFALIFAATGSLVGPLFAHAAINHSNLRLLRDTDPAPRPRSLGGLLRR